MQIKRQFKWGGLKKLPSHCFFFSLPCKWRFLETFHVVFVAKLPSFTWFITFPGRIPYSWFSAENINFYLSSLADLIDSFNETLERFEAELLLKDSNLNAETDRAKASQLNNKDIDSLTMKLSFAHEYLHLGHFCPVGRGGGRGVYYFEVTNLK